MRSDAEIIVVRSATLEDADAIASLLLEAFREFRPLYTESAFAATTSNSGLIRERMSEGPIWVAFAGSQLVGTVAVTPRNDRLYVRSMAVLPSARGMGVGGLLLQQVESFARANGFTRLFLSTTPFLSSAIRLYERSGFTRMQSGPGELFGTPLFSMEKQLG